MLRKADYRINVLSSNGNIKEITKGRHPIWLEEGEKLLYNLGANLFILDIKSRKRNRIGNILLDETPIISLDKKFIAFIEIDSPHGVPVNFLSVISVDGKQKKHIDAYSKRVDLWTI